MKNIHVLPTDKPSRIYLIKSNNKLGITSNNPEFTENFGSGTQNQHIYITSNEEIKVGDWFIDIFNVIHQTTQSTVVLNTYKKIVLTTDQNLIKDGVQAIDDEFLEWFVKNPSCEEVEIDYGFFTPSGKKVDPMGILQNHSKCVWIYKIIIPKEEPKQETLEEVAEKKEQRMYSREEAFLIWRAGQEYWKTSGLSMTFQEITEQLKNK